MTKIGLVLTIFLLKTINVFATEAKINGNISLKQAQYDSLKVNGNFDFEDVEIKNYLKVNGNKKGKNLKCSEIKSNGSFNVDGLIVKDIENNGSFIGKNVEISGVGQFNGKVEITNCKLNDIEISSEKVIFTDCKINKLLIKRSDWHEKKKQVVELHGDSAIGDIEFEKPGEIYSFDKSQVTGKIGNCQVINYR
jgi:hypothetical protein